MKRLQIGFILYFFSIGLVFVGCKKEYVQPILKSTDINRDELSYIDNDESKVYEVVHIIHDDEVDRHDTISYLLRQEVSDTFVDNTNTINKVVSYFKFEAISSSWIFFKKGLFSMKGNSWVKKLDNVSRVVLKFPFSTSINWNVFSYNDLLPLQFQYQQIHKKISINGLEIDSTLTVGSPIFYSLVDFKKQFEIYEKNIGMIYSYSKDLTIRNFDTLNVRLGEEWYYTLKK